MSPSCGCLHPGFHGRVPIVDLVRARTPSSRSTPRCIASSSGATAWARLMWKHFRRRPTPWRPRPASASSRACSPEADAVLAASRSWASPPHRHLGRQLGRQRGENCGARYDALLVKGAPRAVGAGDQRWQVRSSRQRPWGSRSPRPRLARTRWGKRGEWRLGHRPRPKDSRASPR